MERFILEIQQTSGRYVVPSGIASLGEIVGGPEALLDWLEIYLGLTGVLPTKAERIDRTSKHLANVTRCESYNVDSWKTSEVLLKRFDQLLMAGWDGKQQVELPPLVNDFVEIYSDLLEDPQMIGMPGRLMRISDLLEEGAVLPDHELFLYETIERWPKLWRPILEKMRCCDAKQRPRFFLDPLRAQLLDCETEKQDNAVSYQHLTGPSVHALCNAVAVALANDPDSLSQTVIYCEDQATALCMDRCLAFYHLPTMGAGMKSMAHPVLQVLPLALELLWEPVDPQTLLDFITLPIGPIPKRIGWRLAEALSKQPGFGSESWVRAVGELTSQEKDPDGKQTQRIDDWLNVTRDPWGDSLSSEKVIQCCKRVTQWAFSYAQYLKDDHNELSRSLLQAAVQASTLADLVKLQGEQVTEPTLARLREAALSQTVDSTPFDELAGGPRWVSSLAEIRHPYKRLVWLGMTTETGPVCDWTQHELQALNRCGIELDDGTEEIRSLREAEICGFARIEEAVLFVSLPHEQEKGIHPLWLRIGSLLEPQGRKEPVELEKLLSQDETTEENPLAPWRMTFSSESVVPSQPPRIEWNIDHRYLTPREHSSASSIQDRLGCPLKWTLNYQARLKPSPLARLPKEFQLKGTFCHAVLEKVLGEGGELPGEEQVARRVEEVFESRIGLDAAPLVLAGFGLEKSRIKRKLVQAAKNLVNVLRVGGYRVKEMEAPIDAILPSGQKLIGQIDCLAVQEDGRKAVIDFKYYGHSKYTDLLKENRAIQLATYAYSQRDSQGDYPAVAYVILDTGTILTPAGSPISGRESRAIESTSIKEVWRRLVNSLADADCWLTDSKPVPARPLQPSEQWPAGVDLLLKYDDPQKGQEVCRYCDYRVLCGREELK